MFFETIRLNFWSTLFDVFYEGSFMYAMKVLKLSLETTEKCSVGHILNLVSNDTQVFSNLLWHGNYVVNGPIMIFFSIYIIYNMVGSFALISLGILLIISIPMNSIVLVISKGLRHSCAHKTDERVKLVDEIVSGIKIIKMYAWEEPFTKRVHEIRKSEVEKMNRYLMCTSFSIATIFIDRIPTFLTLLIYALVLDINLGSDKIYLLSQTICNASYCGVSRFLRGITSIVEFLVSMKRIEEFLMQREKESEESSNGTTCPIPTASDDVSFNNVTAKWDNSMIRNTLQNVSLSVPKGLLYCILGPVGSGKSSLLSVILKELSITSGSVKLAGKISYASQEPWIFAGTVKDNILFSRPYEQEKYQKVIKACALERDLEIFPQGDNTVVGEKGVCLSGGQRARVNLARAVYEDADIYLLDDPLSAVDTEVVNYLFEECILKYLASKTRILVTHQLRHMAKADSIIVIQNGKIKTEGDIHKIKSSGIDFGKLLQKECDNVNKDNEDYNMIQNSDKRENNPSNGTTVSYKRKSVVKRNVNNDVMENSKESVSEFTQKEICRKYIESGGGMCLVATVICLYISTQFLMNSVDYCISIWANFQQMAESRVLRSSYVNSTSNFSNLNLWDKSELMSVYGGILLASNIVLLVRIYFMFYFTKKSSLKLHKDMFQNVLQGSMKFFDTNTSGRILNRFSKDMGQVDLLLSRSNAEMLQLFLLCLGVFTLIFITNYWLIIPGIITWILLAAIIYVYLRLTSNVKYFEASLSSPIFSHITATINGITTIRSMKSEETMRKIFYKVQDKHTSCSLYRLRLDSALRIWQNIFLTLYITIVILVYIFIPNDIHSGYVGMGISQSLEILSRIQFATMLLAESISHLPSVGRILQYTQIENEEDTSTDIRHVKKSWPQHGTIRFHKFYLRYSQQSLPVLRNINILIEPEQKIGIVGRTGAGKSSLITALFRLAYNEGILSIDDVDINSVSLKLLRKTISIIPQEPVLLSASLRYNLDPFGQFTDNELYQVLEEVEMKEAVKSLDYHVAKGGSNLSVGQRQLVCLARAILRRNKILVLDEATANIDQQTDGLIQEKIRSNFKHCTILTIAHRLSTIMDSDKVLVMSNGMAVEYDHPHILLQNEKGQFFKMVKETGISSMHQFKNIAKMTYIMKQTKKTADEEETRL